MGDDEKQTTKASRSEEELAKDVARLYSWANMEDASYRDFSRKSNLSSAQGPTALSPVAPSPGSQGLARQSLLPITEETVGASICEPPGAPSAEAIGPALALYSIAGGVGKTTLCANLGRLLCSLGEKILLVDASGRGLLPFYFGASELRAGLRTFVAPDVNCPPLQVIGAEETTSEWLQHQVKPAMLEAQRTILDLGSALDLGASWTGALFEIFGMCTAVLVPLLPDLNSILTLSRIETSLKAMESLGKRAPVAYYVFNQFDDSNPSHQGARDLVARRCDQRLLPISIRRGPMAEALDARMTLTDYAPASEVTRDYLELALWLRRVVPIRPPVMLSGHWSER